MNKSGGKSDEEKKNGKIMLKSEKFNRGNSDVKTNHVENQK